MEMRLDAVYCFIVFINEFNTFGQENLHTSLFYFLQVIPEATIALSSLASGEVKQDLIVYISHKVWHPVEGTFSCILR